ncbi:SdrD B-like domain-containing protein [Proteocatella sphenisci]|uniref:SdrD B-like domain-containing protein n=1 Tax=Proteocatella sphenisci TaxID=181070 RepID=UPI00048E67AC|nr:SdrD B-like domain-containing protein [Proteocatella sphenisci]
MRKITRRKRLLSLFTMVILLTSTAWTSFAYADSEGIDQGVPNQLVQELSSEEAPIMPAEETPELYSEENIEQVVGDGTQEEVIEEEVIEEEVIEEEVIEEEVIEEEVIEEELIEEEVIEEEVIEEEVIEEEVIEEEVIEEEVIEEELIEEELQLGANPLIPLAAPYSWLPVVKKQITVRKVWTDGKNVIKDKDTKDFPEVTVEIDFTDKKVKDISLKLNSKNGWKAEVKDIDLRLVYTVKEKTVKPPKGYTLKETVITEECNSPDQARFDYQEGNDKNKCKDIECIYTVINTVIPVNQKQDKKITVKKVWTDGKNVIEDTSGFPEVTVKIDFTDKKVKDVFLKLNEGNKWTKTVDDIDSKLKYTVTEEPLSIPNGYTLKETVITEECNSPDRARVDYQEGNDKNKCEDLECLYTVTNTVIEIEHDKDPIKIVNFEKIWEDEEGNVIEAKDTSNFPTVKIKIYQPADKNAPWGSSIQTLELKSKHGWKASSNPLDVGENTHRFLEFKESSVGIPEGYMIAADYKIDKISEKTREEDFYNLDYKIMVTRCYYTVTNRIVPIPTEGKESIIVTKVWKDGETVIENTVDFPEVKVKIDFTDETVTDIELMLNHGNDWSQTTAEKIDVNLEYNLTEEDVTGLPDGYEIAGTYKVNKNTPYSWTVENTVKKEAEATGTIQGYKFNDLDRDGAWDEGEAGLEGWTITLWKYLGDMDESGNLSVADVENMGTALTDVNGMYQFINLEDGATYYLSENITSMSYWYQTYPVTGPELAGTGKMNIVESVKNGDEITNVNFGNYYDKPGDGGGGNENPGEKGTIQGYKFNDLDRDGAWDEGEAGLEGWTITLWKYLGDMDESGNLSVADVENMGTALTDVNGMYQFINLEDGATYYLSENIASMSYWYQTYPVTGPELAGTGRLNVVELIEAGAIVSDVNFGNYYDKPGDGGNENPDTPDTPSGNSGGGGGGTTVRITPGGGTSNPIAIEAFGPGEEEFITLDMPVFSSVEEPEEIATEAFLEQAVMSAGPDDNPQTSDAGFAMQMQMLGLSLAAMFVLRRKIK